MKEVSVLRARNNGFKKNGRNVRSGYLIRTGSLLISPFLIGFFALTLFPILYSFYLSFTDFDLLGKANWIGFEHLSRMFTEDNIYVKSLKLIFSYAVIRVPIHILL